MPLRACLDCGALFTPTATLQSRCASCERARSQARNAGRPSAHERGYGQAWRAIRERILERDDYTCQVREPGCTVVVTHVDHIVGKAQGGTDDESNLRATCAHCNRRRAAQQAFRPDRCRRPCR